MLQSSPTDAANQAAKEKSLLQALYVLILVGLGLSVAGVTLASFQVTLQLYGIETTGRVIQLHASSSINASGQASYQPEVEFITAAGESVRFTHRTGERPAAYAIDETVTLTYLSDSPTQALINEGFMNWLLPGVLLLIGPTLLVIGVRSSIKLRSKR